MSGGEGVDSVQVVVDGHSGEDVGAGELAVGIQGSDDCAHCLPKAPGSTSQQLVDEEGHAQEEEQVHHGEADDEDIWDSTARAKLL